MSESGYSRSGSPDPGLHALVGARRGPASDRAELHDGWLRVHFGTGTPAHADFHFRWLRHHCEREHDLATGERTLCSSQLGDEIRVVAGYVDAERRLHVQWKERIAGRRVELSESVFTLEWLREHAYAPDREEVSAPPSDLARVEVDARRVGPRWALRAFCFDRLRREGAVVVRRFGADTESLIRFFEQGEVHVVETHAGRIEELRTDRDSSANAEWLGYPSAAVHPHTDQAFLARPPRYQALHCIRPAARGGESFVVDARQAAVHLRSIDAEAFRILTTVPIRHRRERQGFEQAAEAPILELGGPEGFAVRFSYLTTAPYHLPFEQMEVWYRAHDRFARLVRDPRHQIRFALEAGDFVLYDNHRMLHGRSGFSGARWVRAICFDAKEQPDES